MGVPGFAWRFNGCRCAAARTYTTGEARMQPCKRRDTSRMEGEKIGVSHLHHGGASRVQPLKRLPRPAAHRRHCRVTAGVRLHSRLPAPRSMEPSGRRESLRDVQKAGEWYDGPRQTRTLHT